MTDDVRIADLLAHALATSRPVDQVVLPRHLVDRLHREMAELTQRAERAEAQLPIRPDGTHHYVGTGCLHEDLLLPDGRTGHDYCEGETGACGTKIPATCKHCGAKCACPNHRQQPIRPDVSGEDVSEAEIDAAMAAGEPVEIIGSPDLTLGELQDLVDEQGLDLYRAQDRLAYIAEMCDLVDQHGQAVTTARVRMWLEYNGCAGALELPEGSLPTPATGDADEETDGCPCEPLEPWRAVFDHEPGCPEHAPASGAAPATVDLSAKERQDLAMSLVRALQAFQPGAEPVLCHHPSRHISWRVDGRHTVYTATCPDCPAWAQSIGCEPALEPWAFNAERCSEACTKRHTNGPGCLMRPVLRGEEQW